MSDKPYISEIAKWDPNFKLDLSDAILASGVPILSFTIELSKEASDRMNEVYKAALMAKER